MTRREAFLRVLPPLVIALALCLRWWAWIAATGGEGLPIGPDAEDWLRGVAGLLHGRPEALQPNRYPLLPQGAALLARACAWDGPGALARLALASASLLPAAAYLAGRSVLGVAGALAVALWTAVDPAAVTVGVFPTAYGPHAAAFVALAGVLLGGAAGRRGVEPLAALGLAAACTALLNQGLLNVLALLPAGLLARRWRAVGGAAGGALLGVAAVDLLHPRPHDPVGWMLAETRRYLGGNVAEETARTGLDYASTWARWAAGAFQVPAPVVVAAGILGLAGILAAAWRGRGTPTGRRALGLGWALLPLAVLCGLLGSSHHLAHLAPLAAVAVALALRTLLPPRPAAGAALLLLSAMGAWSAHTLPRTVDSLQRRAEEARRERSLARALVERLGPDGLVVVPSLPGGHPTTAIWRCEWALPLTFALRRAPREGEDPAEEARRAGRTAAWAGRPPPGGAPATRVALPWSPTRPPLTLFVLVPLPEPGIPGAPRAPG